MKQLGRLGMGLLQQNEKERENKKIRLAMMHAEVLRLINSWASNFI